MERFILLALLVCCVSGCASRMGWYQEGKSPEERDRDIQDCQHQAMPYGYSWSKRDPRVVGIPPVPKQQQLLNEHPNRQSAKFRDCMEEKGYRLQQSQKIKDHTGAKTGQPSP